MAASVTPMKNKQVYDMSWTRHQATFMRTECGALHSTGKWGNMLITYWYFDLYLNYIYKFINCCLPGLWIWLQTQVDKVVEMLRERPLEYGVSTVTMFRCSNTLPYTRVGLCTCKGVCWLVLVKFSFKPYEYSYETLSRCLHNHRIPLCSCKAFNISFGEIGS